MSPASRHNFARVPSRSPADGRRILAAALFGAVGVAGASVAWASDPGVARQVVVQLRSGADLPGLLSAHALSLQRRLGPRPVFLLRTVRSVDLDQRIAALRADPRVAFAEPNYIVREPEARKRSVWAIGQAGDYAAQYAASQLRLAAAHAYRATTGAGVTVAVIDTGIDATHPALAQRLRPGVDFVDGDLDPSEGGTTADAGYGHGTHVAGLVALAAPGAAIMPLRVLEPSGRGTIWAVAEAVLHAVDPDANPATPDHAQVLNLSLGTTSPTKLLDLAVELATCSDDDDDEDDDDRSDPGFNGDRERCDSQHGSVVIAAAGNGGSATERQYPAAEHAEGALAVTAGNAASRLAGFANRGPWVQIAAPGVNLTSALPGGLYGSWSGTSMAAPLVAGIAALTWAAHPDWKPVDVTKRLLDRAAALCGSTIPRVDARGAVGDLVPPPTVCR
jgi:subtilisin family serine protease